MEKREKFMGVNSIRFYNQFQDEQSCYDYLAAIKWEKVAGNTSSLFERTSARILG